MARQIGSQYRETLEEAGYTVATKLEDGEVILADEGGALSLWVARDDFAGHVVEVNGVGHEFVTSVKS